MRQEACLPEVLAPAGDFERMQAAVQYGADAVYLGGKLFSMRAAPSNFDDGQLAQAVELCHAKAVKLYLTCNTLPTNSEADQLPNFIAYAAAVGVDALIVADIGVLMTAKRVAPELDIHISTQAGVVNYLSARELHNLGATRVVLARELALEDIAVIRDKTPPKLELEAFVHGAMCMSFSGRCVLSQYLVNRDANRGECAQPCRWGYHLMEEKRPGQFFPVFEDEKGSYILNAQDLSMLPYLDRLAQAGVTSFKIEGRAKSAYYVAVIANAYRQAVDLLAADPDHYKAPQWLLDETRKVSHRQYSTGFYLKETPPGQYYQSGGYVRDWEVVATVDGWEDGYLLCTERNRFGVGETLELLARGVKPFPMHIEKLLDGDGTELETARHPMMRLKIPCAQSYPAGSILRREKER